MDNLVLVQIVEELKRGKNDSFSTFFELTKKPIFYNIFALTRSYEISEDLLQDTYVRFLSNISNIDLNQSILGYLMVISRNLTLDTLKKNRINDELDDNKIGFTHSKNEIDSAFIIEIAKKKLKDTEFETFILHLVNDLTFEEISKLIHKPIGTVLRYYNNSIKKIRKEVGYEKDRWSRYKKHSF